MDLLVAARPRLFFLSCFRTGIVGVQVCGVVRCKRAFGHGASEWKVDVTVLLRCILVETVSASCIDAVVRCSNVSSRSRFSLSERSIGMFSSWKNAGINYCINDRITAYVHG